MERVDVLELLRKQTEGGDRDFLREAVAVLAGAVMDTEVTAQVGAGYGERSEARTTRHNGYRPRRWDTRVGTIGLQIPKLRQGSYFPALLEPRRRAERALLSVEQQAYVEGVSTRRVDDLVRALGCEGISRSQVSRICSELDSVVWSFLGRPLDAGPYRYLWLDALTQRVREEGRIAQVRVVVGHRGQCGRETRSGGHRRRHLGGRGLLALLPPQPRGARALRRRARDLRRPPGPPGGRSHRLRGASWQRCRTHLIRNLLTRVPKSAEALVATTVRTIFQQPSAAEVHPQHARVVEQLEGRFPEAAAMLAEASADDGLL